MKFHTGRTKNIRTMMIQILMGTFLVAVAILSVMMYFQNRSIAIQEAEKKIKNLLLEHQALHTYISKQQKPAIAKLKSEGKLHKDYFAPEILSSSFFSKYMHQYYNELRKKDKLDEFYYKLAANNPRNPENKSDDFERDLIQRFNKGEMKEYKQVITKNGQQYLYYALPFATNSQDCMYCHSTPDVAPKELLDRYGDKSGFGEKVGDIRAIISIRAPLAQEIAQADKSFLKIGGAIIGVMLLLLTGGGWLLLRSVTKPISRAVDGLAEGSNQVASASAQVATASQRLAEGASEQAASMEETSSSLEEMSSMTKQNADNSTQADQLMKRIHQIVDQANASITQLEGSMGDISRASQETQKIIKTIDEIAFQTNLLALNAAVEAARAGDAGAGFAVVADEVRNLAMRSAQAAKDTATLIDGTVKTVRNGSELVDRSTKEFGEVASSISKVAELIGEITAATVEQAQGISQVNKALAQAGAVVQQNAAHAEESAAASEEMSAQAQQMKQYVSNLIDLVGNQNTNEAQTPGTPAGKSLTRVASASPKPARTTAGKTANPGKSSTGEKLDPAKVIPFSEDNMDDF